MEVRRITERKEAVLTEMLGDMQPLLAADVPKFMESLASSKVIDNLGGVLLCWSLCFLQASSCSCPHMSSAWDEPSQMN